MESKESLKRCYQLLMGAIVGLLVVARGVAVADDSKAAGAPEASLLCISECSTCPVLCTPPPPSPAPPTPSQTSPPAHRSSPPPPPPPPSSQQTPPHIIISSAPPPPPSGGQRGGLSYPYYYFYTSAASPLSPARRILVLLPWLLLSVRVIFR